VEKPLEGFNEYRSITLENKVDTETEISSDEDHLLLQQEKLKSKEIISSLLMLKRLR